jgi:DNA mismatch repair protein MSH2
MAKKFQKQSATLQDVVALYNVLARLPRLVNEISTNLDNMNDEQKVLWHDNMLVELIGHQEATEKMLELIQTTVDLDAADDHVYRIKPDFDEQLRQLSAQMLELENKIVPIQQAVRQPINSHYEFHSNRVPLTWVWKLTRN